MSDKPSKKFQLSGLASLLCERVSEGVIIFNDAKQEVFKNCAAKKMLEGYKIENLFHANDNDQLYIDNILVKESSHPFTILKEAKTLSATHIEFRNQSGETRHFKINGLVSEEAGNESLYCFLLEDHSHIKKQQEKITKALQDLEVAKIKANAATEAKSDFLSNMRHEIKTPLNVILGMIELFNSAPLENEYRDYLRTLNLAGQNLLTLINDAIDLSNIDSKDFHLEERPYDIKQLVQSIISVLSVRAKDKSLRLSSDIDASLSQLLLGDPDRIYQILMNLLVNALKFTDRGEIEVVIKTKNRDKKQTLLIEVRDTGIGIEESKIETIFEKYQQGSREITQKYGGGGLGLTVCKKLVEMMSGQIWAESALGQGSSFYIELPLRVASLKSVSDVRDNRPTVLFCGMEGVPLTTMIKMTESLNLNVITALSEKEVLDYVAMEKADLVALDLSAPHIDGLRLARRIRSRKIMTPILLHSGAEASDIADIEYLGHISYCRTPFANKEAFIKLLMNQVYLGFDERPLRLLSKLGHLNILLVEDIFDNRMLIHAYFRETKVVITDAENGQIAADLCKEQNFDLIIMDMQMPVMDGIQATKMIHDYQKDNAKALSPVIALTAISARQDFSKKAIEAGCRTVLSKPVRKRELILAIINSFEKQLSQPISFYDYSQTKSFDEKKFEENFDKSILASKKELDLIIEDFIVGTNKLITKIEHDVFRTAFEELKPTTDALESFALRYGALRMAEIARELSECAENTDRKTAYSLIQSAFFEFTHVRDLLHHFIKTKKQMLKAS